MALSSELQRLQPYIDRAKTFSGWDLGFIRSRSLDGPVPWDYEREAREMAVSATTALDVGTGGGEVYSRIAAGLRGQFVACEQWGVNARVAHARLHAMGIPVVRCQTGETPLLGYISRAENVEFSTVEVHIGRSMRHCVRPLQSPGI